MRGLQPAVKTLCSSHSGRTCSAWRCQRRFTGGLAAVMSEAALSGLSLTRLPSPPPRVNWDILGSIARHCFPCLGA
ncbi:unnamed protein product [Urochloa humidicola]